MPLQSLNYEAPVRRGSSHTPLDYDQLEAAGTLAEEGRPLESLLKVLGHLFPNKPLPDLSKEPFVFTQGSSKVTTRIENDDIIITVPLVRLPTDGRAIAALRHVLTAIAATGQLYQPRLVGDDIHLEFRDRLSRFHPAKVIEVMQRMPEEADSNDDFLIGQFGAQPLERSPVLPLDDDEFARCLAIWKGHWNDVEEILKECQKKRSKFFLNETTAYAIYRIKFALPLCGFVASKLDDAANTFNDGHEDPLKRESALARCIKDMRAVTDESLRQSLGHATYAISPLAEGTGKTISGHLDGGYIETVQRLKKEGKPFDAALAMIGTYNYLLARWAWAEPVALALKEGLALASGKPWKEAANILLEHAETVVDKYGEDEDDEEDDDDDDDDDDDEDDDDEEGDE